MKLITITFSVLYMLLLLSGCAAKPNETSFSEKSETKLIGTSDPEMGSGSPQPEKVDTDDKNARIARELLTEADPVWVRRVGRTLCRWLLPHRGGTDILLFRCIQPL